MKYFWTKYRTGLLSLIPVVIAVYIVIKICTGLWDLSGGRWWLTIILLVLPFFFGLLVTWQIFRDAALRIFSNVPGLGIVVNFFLNREYVERLAKSGFPEVVFRHTEDSWTIGTVTNDFQVPANWIDGPIVDWVAILGPPTAPVSVTAPIFFRHRSKVVFTGRFIKDTAITAASLGTKFVLDRMKISSTPPQQ